MNSRGKYVLTRYMTCFPVDTMWPQWCLGVEVQTLEFEASGNP